MKNFLAFFLFLGLINFTNIFGHTKKKFTIIAKSIIVNSKSKKKQLSKNKRASNAILRAICNRFPCRTTNVIRGVTAYRTVSIGPSPCRRFGPGCPPA
jgi:hypothetical protein